PPALVDPVVIRVQLSALLAYEEARAPGPDALTAAARGDGGAALLLTLAREADALLGVAEVRRWHEPRADVSAPLGGARARLALCLARAPSAHALAVAARLAAFEGHLPEAYAHLRAADLVSGTEALTLAQLRWTRAAVRLLDPAAPAAEPWAALAALSPQVFETPRHERYAQLAAERAGDAAGARAHHARFTHLLASAPPAPPPLAPHPSVSLPQVSLPTAPALAPLSAERAPEGAPRGGAYAEEPAAAAAPAAAAPAAPPPAPSAPAGEGFEELMRQGEALLERGRVVAARAHFERALAARPQSADALSQLGWCELAAGHAARAQGKFRAALSATPQHADALYGLGYAAEALGDWREARRHLERYLALYPAGSKVRIVQNKLSRMPK
ncbi:MAG: tetratricopeptide repeat protein, partial [Deltaproteobacteria bacterium]|nr:tetratricopeptide repeat protein [Deltaproteobacteria bacterium]